MQTDDNAKKLTQADRAFLWHPFTQMRQWSAEDPTIIVEGRGCFLKDTHGRWYLDGVSSLWVNIHGHRRPELDEAIISQLGRIAHSTQLGLASPPAIELGQRLVKLMRGCLGPQAPSRVFYSDNGSTAVEASLKMAFQHWAHRGQPERTGFLALTNAYHGDTLGAVSVGGVDIFHSAFKPLLFDVHRAPAPYCYRCPLKLSPEGCQMACLGQMEAILEKHSKTIAAVIVEPLVQAAGGMIVWPKGYLKALSALCSRYGVLLIADEVATGFGRTGRMFACEHEGVAPDIICLSKGLTGGYMPLAATIAKERIYESFLGGFGELKTFFHGHSYTGNQLGCAVALASLDIFEKEQLISSLGSKVKLLVDWTACIKNLGHVGDAKALGLMAGVELVRDKKTREPYAWEDKIGWKVANLCREQGVLLRPLGNVIVIMPPLAIALEDLQRMLEVIEEAVAKTTG